MVSNEASLCSALLHRCIWLVRLPKHATSGTPLFCPTDLFYFFLLKYMNIHCRVSILFAYRLCGANISHCLRLCILVTMSSSQALIDHLCKPVRDNVCIHTCQLQYKSIKCCTRCHFCCFISLILQTLSHTIKPVTCGQHGPF